MFTIIICVLKIIFKVIRTLAPRDFAVVSVVRLFCTLAVTAYIYIHTLIPRLKYRRKRNRKEI